MSALRSWVSRQRQEFLSRLSVRAMALETDAQVLSVCFDDFPRSALLAGGAILEACGGRGTYYAAPGLMNQENELGEQFRREDLEALLDAGHELGSHTFSHLSCRAATPAAFAADVLRGRQALEDLTGRDVVNFAYPYGHVSARVKKSVGSSMASCRGIFHGVNGPVADLNLLRANSLYGDRDQLPQVKKLLAENRYAGTWLILYTHDVRERPSPFGCTPALLEETLAFALHEGFTIAPVSMMTKTARTGAKLPAHTADVRPQGLRGSE